MLQRRWLVPSRKVAAGRQPIVSDSESFNHELFLPSIRSSDWAMQELPTRPMSRVLCHCGGFLGVPGSMRRQSGGIASLDGASAANQSCRQIGLRSKHRDLPYSRVGYGCDGHFVAPTGFAIISRFLVSVSLRDYVDERIQRVPRLESVHRIARRSSQPLQWRNA